MLKTATVVKAPKNGANNKENSKTHADAVA